MKCDAIYVLNLQNIEIYRIEDTQDTLKCGYRAKRTVKLQSGSTPLKPSSNAEFGFKKSIELD